MNGRVADLEYPGRDLEAMHFAINYHKWILKIIRPFVNGRVVEVGAGTGDLSRLLLEEGVAELLAIEPSWNAFAALQARLMDRTGAQTVHGTLRSVKQSLGAETADTVLYVNVLEHIAEDIEELWNARDVLAATGHLVVFAPALSWLYSDHDREIGHVRRYSLDELVTAVERAGFRVCYQRYFDFAGIWLWFVAYKLFKRRVTGSDVDLYDRLVVPVMRRVEGLIAPPLGKNVLVVAKPNRIHARV